MKRDEKRKWIRKCDVDDVNLPLMRYRRRGFGQQGFGWKGAQMGGPILSDYIKEKYRAEDAKPSNTQYGWIFG
jgi:hypothetical protein